MKKPIYLFVFLFFHSFLYGQKATLSGYVKDKITGEVLIGAVVSQPNTKNSVVTNAYGFYSISLPIGEVNIKTQYFGYEPLSQTISLSTSLTLDIELAPSFQELGAVEVTGEKGDENLKSVEMSVAKISVKEIKAIPQLLGETDIIRTLTLLPGISTVGEGANGFNVRGGAADQNLILLDDAPVFSSSHLFGFFSVFNADAVKDVKLYKGGIPAKYGGRLSSVLDIRQKDGNLKKFSGSGGLGLLSSRLLLEGPIVKDKVSFIVGGRRSYQDIFFALSSNEDIRQTALYFYDLNAKVNAILGSKDRLYLSSYFGKDVFSIDNAFGFGWGNTTVSLRWNHLFSDKLFFNATTLYSNYNYNLGSESENEDDNFRLDAKIKNFIQNLGFTHYINTRMTLEYGMNSTYYIIEPGEISAPDFFLKQDLEYALEPAFYISNEHNLTDKLTAQYGLRYSMFFNLGPGTVFDYDNPDYPDINEVAGSTDYDRLDLIKGFTGIDGLEPRLSVNYKANEKNAFKGSYNRTRQYIHLISNTTTPTPIDLWRPSGTYINPATVDQVAAGYFRNFKENQYQFSVETYYKWFYNLVDYRQAPAPQLLFNENLETDLLTGRGRAYGLEFFLEKKRGKLTGWLSYTLSRSERKVKGIDRNTSINNGEWYSANYDKTHDISLVLSYAVNKSWNVSANFAYQTGRPFTPPESKSVYENLVYPNYELRNQGRIPDYHRLDLSANYDPVKNKDRKWKSSYSFGFYNVYNRRNAYSIFFRPSEENPAELQAIRLSIFASIVPYFTYNFSF